MSTMRALQRSRAAQVLRTQVAGGRVQAFRPARSYATIEARPATDAKPASQVEQDSEDLSDPKMNGNYPDPNLENGLPIKRQFRDPYADWWDKQERRNYGETVHEDNDILGVFSPEEYTWVTPGKGALQVLAFIGAFCSVLFAVAQVYPDKPSAPRTFDGGLEAEYGGSGGMRARNEEEGESW